MVVAPTEEKSVGWRWSCLGAGVDREMVVFEKETEGVTDWILPYQGIPTRATLQSPRSRSQNAAGGLAGQSHSVCG